MTVSNHYKYSTLFVVVSNIFKARKQINNKYGSNRLAPLNTLGRALVKDGKKYAFFGSECIGIKFPICLSARDRNQ